MELTNPTCGVCHRRQCLTPSTVWCFECDEGLCDSCNSHHKLSKSSRGHKTIPIFVYLELPQEVREIKELCGSHEEKFQIFCHEHSCPCCRSCIVENHKKCQDIDSLEKVIRGIKTSSAVIGLEQTLSSLTENLNRIRNDKEGNMRRLQEQRNQIREEIKTMKINIKTHIDKLEGSLLQKLDSVVDNVTLEINLILNTLSEQEAWVSKAQKILAVVKRCGSELQTFLMTKQTERYVAMTDNRLVSMETTGRLKNIDLHYLCDEGLQNLQSSIQRFGNVGTTDFVRKRKLLPQLSKQTTSQDQTLQPMDDTSISKVDLSQIKEALTPIPVKPWSIEQPTKEKFDKVCVQQYARCIEEIKLTLKQKITTGGKNIRGLTALPGNRLAFSSFNERQITIVDSNGSEVSKLPTPACAYDLAYIQKENKIAVSSGGNLPCLVSLIDIKQREQTQSFTLVSYVYGIAVNGDIIVASVKGSGLFKININGGSDRVQKMHGFEALNGFDTYVVISCDRVYITSWFAGKVLCFDMNGSTIWTFSCAKHVGRPFGITMDTSGFIYVVGENSSVGVLSADGQSFKILVSKGEGPVHPKAITYDSSNHELLVASHCRDIYRYSIKFVH